MTASVISYVDVGMKTGTALQAQESSYTLLIEVQGINLSKLNFLQQRHFWIFHIQRRNYFLQIRKLDHVYKSRNKY